MPDPTDPSPESLEPPHGGALGRALTERILSPSCHALAPDALIAGLAEDCERLGLPLVRVSTSIATLHPEVFALNVQWSRAEGPSSRLVEHAVRGTSRYEGSPAQRIIDGGADAFTVRLDGTHPDLPLFDELHAMGVTEYLIQPLRYQDGRRTFISWATDRPGGFGDARAGLDALLPLLTLRLGLAAAHHATTSLLEVYLGANAARRVLSGAFKRGTGTSIHAALWYCDMRGFTRLGDRLTPEALVAVLDRYFEAVAGPIVSGGGEILKFIGDAVLAVFPVGSEGPAQACAAALEAAEQAVGAVGALELPDVDAPLQIGVGLHLGHVTYGNIGARQRLDFTVIGGSVNEVARLEALCKEVGAPVLMSGRFREALARSAAARADLVEVGRFELRGVSAGQEVHTVQAMLPTER